MSVQKRGDVWFSSLIPNASFPTREAAVAADDEQKRKDARIFSNETTEQTGGLEPVKTPLPKPTGKSIFAI